MRYPALFLLLLLTANASFSCDVCKVSVEALHQFASNEAVIWSITSIIKVAILVRVDWVRANLIVNSYTTPIVDGLYKKFLNPKFMC